MEEMQCCCVCVCVCVCKRVRQRNNIEETCYCFCCAVNAAEGGVDFNRTSRNVTFTPNEPLMTRKCFTLDIFDDNIYEGEEQYGLHMFFDHRFTTVNSPARLFIRENDGEGKRVREGGRGGNIM